MTMLAITFCAVVCAALILLLEKLAPKVGLTDTPSGRKQHQGNIPVVGGIAILVGVAFTVLMLDSLVAPTVLIALSFLILLVGMADDIHSLSARFKLLAQIAIAWGMVSIGGMRIESVGSIFGGEPIMFYSGFGTIFSIICITGVINAVNMIDGVDGLAGSLLLISFAAIAILSAGSADSGQTLFLLCLVSSLLVFLFYNCRLDKQGARVFLGDSGSMMLGLILSWYLISLSQNQDLATDYSAVIMMWLFGLPLMETVVLVINRISDKRSPFDAGRDHIHHRLIDSGLGVNATVFVIALIHFCLVCIGVVFSSTQGMDAFLFWSYCALTVLYFMVMRFILMPDNSLLKRSIHSYRRGRVG